MQPGQDLCQQTSKREFPAVDIAKFICALLVITIHVKPFNDFSHIPFAAVLNYGIAQYLARIAVPFYFAAAGFFLFGKVDTAHWDSSVFKSYIFKNLRLLGLWCCLLSFVWIGHLWYMRSLVVGVLILTVLLNHKLPLKKVVILALILYVVGLIGDTYLGMLAPLRKYKLVVYVIKAFDKIGGTRNGIFMGFPLLLLGGLIRKHPIGIKPRTAFLGFVASMVALFLEALALKLIEWPGDYNMYIFLIPAELFLLSFVTTIKIKERPIYKKMRVAGVIIYFLHPAVDYFLSLVFRFVKYVSGIDLANSLIYCIGTIIVSSLLGFALERLSHTRKFHFVRYLYS